MQNNSDSIKTIFLEKNDPKLDDLSWQIVNEIPIDHRILIYQQTQQEREIKEFLEGKYRQRTICFQYITIKYAEQGLNDQLIYDLNYKVTQISKNIKHPIRISDRRRLPNSACTTVDFNGNPLYVFKQIDITFLANWATIDSKFVYYPDWQFIYKRIYVQNDNLTQHIFQNPVQFLIVQTLPNYDWDKGPSFLFKQQTCIPCTVLEPIVPWDVDPQLITLAVNDQIDTSQLQFYGERIPSIKYLIVQDIDIGLKYSQGYVRITGEKGNRVDQKGAAMHNKDTLYPKYTPGLKYIALTNSQGFEINDMVIFDNMPLNGLYICGNFDKNPKLQQNIQTIKGLRFLGIDQTGQCDEIPFGTNQTVQILMFIRPEQRQNGDKKTFINHYLRNLHQMKLVITNDENIEFKTIPVIKLRDFEMRFQLNKQVKQAYLSDLFECIDQFINDPYELYNQVYPGKKEFIQLCIESVPKNIQLCIKATDKWMKELQLKEEERYYE